MFAQRRPGREPRRHARRPTGPTPPARSLNEGRGANPGDTVHAFINSASSGDAQRRPGREPRRHVDDVLHSPRRDRRSTKAGARTPATRPGRPPPSPCRGPLNEGRGANPGDTRGRAYSWARSRGALNEGRGANPGDTPTRAAPRRPGPALNEGRGANPGDTRRGVRARVDGLHAQRRPGREPRRHATRGGADEEVVARSTKAGARTPATHRPAA